MCAISVGIKVKLCKIEMALVSTIVRTTEFLMCVIIMKFFNEVNRECDIQWNSIRRITLCQFYCIRR